MAGGLRPAAEAHFVRQECAASERPEVLCKAGPRGPGGAREGSGTAPQRQSQAVFEGYEQVFREVGAPARGGRPARRLQPSFQTGSVLAARGVTRQVGHGVIAVSDLRLPARLGLWVLRPAPVPHSA